ncbi:MAG: N-6 DNA methylase [Synergistaceae bacterium]|nr:N-6 DNA methylase [Synergistaceae bacterium]
MYQLAELFRNSTHDYSAFTPETVSAIESLIYTKTQRGREVPYIRCIIRDKEIRLTPEEAVRQLYVYTLIHEYGYGPERIKLEHGINFGREVKRADIVIFEKDHPTSEYIIVEVKKPKVREGKAQLKSYCNASGAIIGVWTNGEDFSYYHRKDPNYFENIPGLPKASQKLRDILRERWTISDLEAKDRLRDGSKSLTSLIQEMEDDVLADAGVDVFEEVFKLIYTKLYDEMQSGRDKSRVLEFRNYGDTDADLKANIQELFRQAMKKWPGVFGEKDGISLTPSHLSVCVSALQGVKLFNSNLDVVDDAFEYLMSKSSKGEKGQFFTPRYVIDMCVRMLNPQEHEAMIDTAAGSCGFPVHTIFHVWRQILAEKGIEQSHLFTAEEKPPECQDYVKDKVFAIDFDEKTVRVARTLNLIAGDGRTNVLHLNTLDYGRWDETVKPRQWQKTYNEGWLRFTDFCEREEDYSAFTFDIVMANPPFAGDIKEGKIISRYELAKDARGKYVSRIGRDILFIERNLQFLKPGGRMAIILPQGRFNNSSDKYIRDFIAGQCRILAVIGLHENVFKPHTGTKTSVLLVQKWDDELCPRREDYPVFFATMRKPGKDNSGEKILRKDEAGRLLLDSHNHVIVEHDLYNHEGLTEDGIAEAFIEFARREGLSFFGDARFAEERYRDLVSGLEVSEVAFSEIVASGRMDTEYYSRRYSVLHEATTSRDYVLLRDIVEMHDVFSNGAFAFVLDTLKDDGEKVIPYIRSQNVGNMFINSGELARISAKAHELLPLSQTKLHDIMMARTGKIGGASIITQSEVNYNCNQNVIKLTINEPEKYNPYYIAAFFNSRYGILQVERESTGNVQPWVNISKLKELKCFIATTDFQSIIARQLEEAHNMLAESESLYTAAQSLLTDSLGHVPQDPRNTATVPFSRAFSTGRLDAEYFMPKYDGYIAFIHSFKGGCATIGSLFSQVTSRCPRDEPSYRYVEIGDIDTGTGAASYNEIDTADLPDNAKIMTRAGDILVSKVRPNRGAVAILEDDNLLVSGAFTVLRKKSEYSCEMLQVILRSDLYRELLLRYNVGTSYPVIKDEDILNMPVPLLDHDTQEKISGHVRESFTLRRESERLIAAAVRAVELAIGYNEDTALQFLAKET